jgi:hypothetical protein
MLQFISTLLICIALFGCSYGTPTNRVIMNFLPISSFEQMNKILSDPCLSVNCQFGEICIQNIDLISYNCVNEKALAIKMKANPNQDPSTFVEDNKVYEFLTNYPVDFHVNLNDPCLSSPCQFGTICKSANHKEFMCIDEKRINKDLTNVDRSQVSNLFNALNTPKQVNTNSFTQLRGQGKKMASCSSNPCPSELDCVPSKTSTDEYQCVERQRSQDTDVTSGHSEVTDLKALCRNKDPGTRVFNPDDNRQFLSCSTDGGFVLLSCPDQLFYNRYSDRCDYSMEPISSGCGSMPCQYGGECIDLPDDQYKCQCSAGYSGKNCQEQPDFCVSSPCGKNGVCISLPWDSPMPYYCTCSDEKYFGMACDKNVEKNPCLHDNEGTIFPTTIDSSIYVHCNGDKLTLKYCLNNSVYSEETQDCEWADGHTVDEKQRRK